MSRRLRIVLIVLLILAVVWVALDYISAARLNTTLDAIREQGDPASLEEFLAEKRAPNPEAGEGRVGEFIYSLKPSVMAYPGVTVVGGWTDGVPSFDQQQTWAAWSPEVEADLRRVVDANRDLLAKAHELFSLPSEPSGVMLHYAFPTADMPLWSGKIPDLLTMRGIQNLLTMEAMLYAKTGDTAGAVAALDTAFNSARHMSSCMPSLINEMIGVALRSLAIINLGMLNEVVAFSNDDASKLDAQLQAIDTLEGLVRGFKLERLSIAEFQSAIAADSSLEWRNIFANLYGARPLRFWLNHDINAGVRVMTLAVEAAGTPRLERKPVEDRMQQEIAELSWKTPLSTTAIPNLLRSSQQEDEAIGFARLARITLALNRYKQDNGAYPENLDALAPEYIPEIPQDPFSGNPPSYKMEGAGYDLAIEVGERSLNLSVPFKTVEQLKNRQTAKAQAE